MRRRYTRKEDLRSRSRKRFASAHARRRAARSESHMLSRLTQTKLPTTVATGKRPRPAPIITDGWPDECEKEIFYPSTRPPCAQSDCTHLPSGQVLLFVFLKCNRRPLHDSYRLVALHRRHPEVGQPRPIESSDCRFPAPPHFWLQIWVRR